MAGFWKQAVRPLESNFGALLGGRRQTRVNPTDTLGSPGTAIYGGYVVENEKDSTLTDRERYKTFSEALANTAVVAAGVRYFLNLAAGATWTFEPAETPAGEDFAERAERMMTEDPVTSWPRVVRRAAMYRFYGFSIQEWTARRDDEGALTFADIAPRAQITIERWDVNTDGTVNGMVQRNPQNQQEIYLPRGKTIYMVDDTLNDSPMGLGLFRHIVEPVRRLNRYEQLEGFGFESDLRGIPIGRAPYAELRARVESGEITAAQAIKAVAPIEEFIKKHVRKPDLGLLLDSEVFVTTDDATRPSSEKKFDLSLLDGSQTSLPEVAAAIQRINLEIARVLGIESLLMGDGTGGSFALAKDKTSQFSLTIDATLNELVDAFTTDLLDVLWMLNGWPEEEKPKIKVESVQYRSIEEITAAIRDIANSGAMLEPNDPIINFIRGLLGAPMADLMDSEIDAALNGSVPDDPVEEGETIEAEGAIE